MFEILPCRGVHWTLSRASQRNALLIQHCYSPYGTIQLEKTNPISPVEVLNDLNRVLHGISLNCKYCIVFDCFSWYCIASYCMALYCILLFVMVLHGIIFLFCMVLHRLHSVVQLISRAGELPRSASSHFYFADILFPSPLEAYAI